MLVKSFSNIRKKNPNKLLRNNKICVDDKNHYKHRQKKSQ